MPPTSAISRDDIRMGTSLPSSDECPQRQLTHATISPQIESSTPSWLPLESPPPDASSLRSEKETYKHGCPNDSPSNIPLSASPTLSHCKGSTKMSFRNMMRFRPSLILENHGSVARDHLASERTFLAYVRTSLAVAGAGVALVQLLTIASLTSQRDGFPSSAEDQKLRHLARPIGVTSVIFALIILAIGVYRYFRIQRALVEQMFPTARISVAFTSFGLGIIVVVIFGVFISCQN